MTRTDSSCRGRGYGQIPDFKRHMVNTGLRFMADEGVSRREERQSSGTDAEYGHRALAVANGTIDTPQPEKRAAVRCNGWGGGSGPTQPHGGQG
jgi:hypothetical protein